MTRISKLRSLNRRHFTRLSASSLLYWMASGAVAAVASHSNESIAMLPRKPLKRNPVRTNFLGTTFSQLQCQYIGLDYKETFRRICTLGFDRIRLCSYWHELEAIEKQFDFTALDWLLDESDRHGIQVVLAIGVKAPRWPEFHFPDWLKLQYDTNDASVPLDLNAAIADRSLHMIDRVVHHTRFAPALKYWQVENEPFTGMEITAGRRLRQEFVRQEVELVRSQALPAQKLLLTNAIALPHAQSEHDDRAFEASVALADAVGINVYTKVPHGDTGSYLEPSPAYWNKLHQWKQTLTQQGKDAWIAEAQAEPWESQKLVALDQMEYPSASPAQVSAIVDTVQQLDYRTVMLWGCEYWYWHYKNGRNQWWQFIQQLIQQALNA